MVELEYRRVHNKAVIPNTLAQTLLLQLGLSAFSVFFIFLYKYTCILN